MKNAGDGLKIVDVKLPCGKTAKVEKHVEYWDDHLIIENICFHCKYQAACGRFYDWFLEHHQTISKQ